MPEVRSLSKPEEPRLNDVGSAAGAPRPAADPRRAHPLLERLASILAERPGLQAADDGDPRRAAVAVIFRVAPAGQLELLLIQESPVIYSVSSVTFAGQLSTVKNRRVAPPFSQWFSSEIWLDE